MEYSLFQVSQKTNMYIVVWGGLGVWNLYGHGISLFIMKKKQTLNNCQRKNMKKKLDCFKTTVRALFNKLNVEIKIVILNRNY